MEQPPATSGDGDIYDSVAVLDAAYDAERAAEGGEPYVLCIEVQDVPGVLNQVTGVFARRGYNVQSLAVGNSEREGMSRITMVLPASTAGITKLIKQLNKLVYVEKVGVGVATCGGGAGVGVGVGLAVGEGRGGRAGGWQVYRGGCVVIGWAGS